MEKEMVLNKFVGESLLNLVRQAALTRLREVRPIAFCVGDSLNVVSMGDLIEEDTAEFVSKVNFLMFQAKRETELLKVETTCKEVLRASDLENDSVFVIAASGEEILHSFSEVPVTIYFRNAAGKYSVSENEQFLQHAGVKTDNLVVVNSRHRPLSSFSVEKLSERGEYATFRIQILPSIMPAEEVFAKAVESVKVEMKGLY